MKINVHFCLSIKVTCKNKFRKFIELRWTGEGAVCGVISTNLEIFSFKWKVKGDWIESLFSNSHYLSHNDKSKWHTRTPTTLSKELTPAFKRINLSIWRREPGGIFGNNRRVLMAFSTVSTCEKVMLMQFTDNEATSSDFPVLHRVPSMDIA